MDKVLVVADEPAHVFYFQVIGEDVGPQVRAVIVDDSVVTAEQGGSTDYVSVSRGRGCMERER